MAIGSNYGIMQLVIADEIGNRTDLLTTLSDSGLTLSPIKLAIQSAIAKWEREPFYFNESVEVFFTTVAGRELYGADTLAPLAATTPDIYAMHLLIGANRYPLTRRSMEWMEEHSISATATGQPTDWAFFAQLIRLYPTPDAANQIEAWKTKVLTALSGDADTNVWMADAYDLIKSEAKLILAREVLHDDDLANRMQAAIYGNPVNPRERGYLGALKAETTRRARSRIKPTAF